MWKKLWPLAYPVMVGGLSQSLVNSVDLAMVGRLGKDALSSVGLGATTIWIIVSALGSIQIGTQALTSRRWGEGGIEESLKVLSNSLMFALVIAIPFSLVGILLSKDILSLLTSHSEVVHQGAPYLRYRFIGLLFVIPAISMKGFFSGIGETRVYMKAALLINLLNLVLDYLLIFGAFSLPALGVRGAAIASVLSFFAGTLYLILTAYGKGYLFLRLKDIERKTLSILFNLSIYPAIQVVLTLGGIWVFLWMAGRIGREELALSNIFFQILSLTFLLGVGLGVAAVTLMGRSIGEGRIERVEEIGWVAFKMGALVMSGIGLLFILFPGEVIGIFTSEDQLLQDGRPVILLLGIVQVFWAMGITLSYTLQGIGDAKGVMKIEVIIHWLIFLPLSYILAFSLGYELIGLWAGFSVYIVLLGLAMGWRFNKGLWKELKT